jgi:hypothetical protein
MKILLSRSQKQENYIWDVTPPVELHRRFRGTYRLQLHSRRVSQVSKNQKQTLCWRWQYFPPKRRWTSPQCTTVTPQVPLWDPQPQCSSYYFLLPHLFMCSCRWRSDRHAFSMESWQSRQLCLSVRQSPQLTHGRLLFSWPMCCPQESIHVHGHKALPSSHSVLWDQKATLW